MVELEKVTSTVGILIDLYSSRYGITPALRKRLTLSSNDKMLVLDQWILAFTRSGIYGYHRIGTRLKFKVTKVQGVYYFKVLEKVDLKGKVIFPQEQMISKFEILLKQFNGVGLNISITERSDFLEYDDGINLWQI